MTGLNIVYEDDALLVVDKPAGLLMHPSWLDKREKDTLASRVKTYLVGASFEGKVHTVHRLDRPTSGLVVIAKQDAAARNLNEQFQQQTVEKIYWAICRGFIADEQLIDYPLKEEHDKIADKFANADKAAQPAQTFVKRIGIAEVALPVSRYAKSRLSLIECKPVTGRKHQIRRHLKHIRHPLLGDTRHGCRHTNRAYEAEFGEINLALRAVRLSFRHPVSNELLVFKAPENDDWQTWLSYFGWR